MGKKAIALRIDEQLWQQLQQWADAELRSINGQIEYLLREAVRRRRGKQSEPESKQVGGSEMANREPD